MAKRVAFYVRVSTNDQTVDNQIAELQQAAERHGWDVVHIFADRGISGCKGRADRPEFDRLLKGVARREFDMVAAWSVDRLGRSLQDLASFLGEIHGKSVDLFLLRQGIDTSTPAGRAMFQMFGVFAEFEASIIRERVRAGVSRAQAHGTKSGRAIGRPRVDSVRETICRNALKGGTGVRAAARAASVGVGTAQRIRSELDATA